MKQVGVKIKKCLALSLMMIYLVISLSNLFFLPKYNRHQTVTEAGITASVHLHPGWLYNGAGNTSILFHRACKSIIENRQNLAIFFKTAATVFLLMLMGSLSRLVLNSEGGNAGFLFPDRREYAYLNFCSLRI